MAYWTIRYELGRSPVPQTRRQERQSSFSIPTQPIFSASGISDDISAISANDVAAAAVPQTGASDYLTSTPVVGPTAANLTDTSLGSLLPTVITNLLNNVISDVQLPSAPP